MEALVIVLDDSWDIYVQPFLNGLQPDIIIFSESAGMGIFEVKDWHLSYYRPKAGGCWDVRDRRQGGWQVSKVRCPIEQVKHYKDSIIKYELPELEAEKSLDKDIYGLVAPFVYFHCHSTADAQLRTRSVADDYITVLGHDALGPETLRYHLNKRYLRPGSKFSIFMRRSQLKNRLRNALDYPEHGRLDVSDILFQLSPDQKRLLSNAPGKRRVIGAAGSGKTLMLVRKAVNAALSNQKVLILCFNITMVNYLDDIVRQLVRHKNADTTRILVRHFHRVFDYPIEKDNRSGIPYTQLCLEWASKPLEEVLKDQECMDLKPFDIILIDEGQDFSREWIERIYQLGHADLGGDDDRTHIMFVEDDRQNIYGVDTAARRVVPGILGRPNEMKRSFRINQEVAALANELAAWSNRTFDSADVVTMITSPGGQLRFQRPIWYQGSAEQMMATLHEHVRAEIDDNRSGALSDLVILVCTVEDGWKVTDSLRALDLPYITNFETQEEYNTLAKRHSNEKLQMERDSLRRGRKKAFRMQTGRIKVCTIHSFKGWELKRVLVYFRLDESQQKQAVPLLYTAMTRSQDAVVIFNAEPGMNEFGRHAANKGLLDSRDPGPLVVAKGLERSMTYTLTPPG